jgi:hypothetical protein
MHHIDDVLGWLAYIFVHRLNIQAVQFWANQRTSAQQVLFEARASIWQDQSFPGSLLTNQHVASVGKRFLESGRTVVVQHVNMLFSSYQATLFSRHGLNFCAGYTLSQSNMLPPPSLQSAALQVPTPLAMVVLYFFRQTPQESLLLSSQGIVEQALVIAQKRGLLLPPTEFFSSPPPSPQPAQTWTLSQLIPRRMQSVEALQASNPFANTVVISDKKARQLYSAIDGHKSFAELVQLTRLDQKAFIDALCFLLTNEYIQFYEPGGEAVDSATIFKSLS